MLTRIPCIYLEAEPVEEICEDSKHPQQPLRLGRRDESTVYVEVRRHVLYQHNKSLRACLCCRHHRHPVADDNVHNHVE